MSFHPVQHDGMFFCNDLQVVLIFPAFRSRHQNREHRKPSWTSKRAEDGGHFGESDLASKQKSYLQSPRTHVETYQRPEMSVRLGHYERCRTFTEKLERHLQGRRRYRAFNHPSAGLKARIFRQRTLGHWLETRYEITKSVMADCGRCTQIHRDDKLTALWEILALTNPSKISVAIRSFPVPRVLADLSAQIPVVQKEFVVSTVELFVLTISTNLSRSDPATTRTHRDIGRRCVGHREVALCLSDTYK